jgi:hypothetical protein
MRSDRLPRVQLPEEDRCRIGVAVTGAAERAGARWLNTSGSWLAAATRPASRLSFCWASRAETTRLSTMTPRT